jgi:hypothetical protein
MNLSCRGRPSLRASVGQLDKGLQGRVGLQRSQASSLYLESNVILHMNKSRFHLGPWALGLQEWR